MEGSERVMYTDLQCLFALWLQTDAEKRMMEQLTRGRGGRDVEMTEDGAAPAAAAAGPGPSSSAAAAVNARRAAAAGHCFYTPITKHIRGQGECCSLAAAASLLAAAPS